MPKLFF